LERYLLELEEIPWNPLLSLELFYPGYSWWWLKKKKMEN